MAFATAIVIGIALVLPRYAPQLKRGANCYNRPNIVGGNQQSVLAATDKDQQLTLEVYVTNSIDPSDYTIHQGASLMLDVVFRNNGGSPISLYLDEHRIAMNRAEIPQGLAIRINPENDPTGYLADTDKINRSLYPPPNNNYDFDNVYVIEGHRSCHISVEIDQDDFRRVAIVPNIRYELVAIYNNELPGILPVAADTTATPMFDNLGVWDEGTIESDDITFIIIP
jgi:hypothetical protein